MDTFLPVVCALLNCCWMVSKMSSARASFTGWFTSHCLAGANRMRAPLAPPRLSEPRKVEAEAHAVATSCAMESPDARMVLLSAAMSWASISA